MNLTELTAEFAVDLMKIELADFAGKFTCSRQNLSLLAGDKFRVSFAPDVSDKALGTFFCSHLIPRFDFTRC